MLGPLARPRRFFGGRQLKTSLWDGITNYAQVKVRAALGALDGVLALQSCCD